MADNIENSNISEYGQLNIATITLADPSKTFYLKCN